MVSLQACATAQEVPAELLEEFGAKHRASAQAAYFLGPDVGRPWEGMVRSTDLASTACSHLTPSPSREMETAPEHCFLLDSRHCRHAWCCLEWQLHTPFLCGSEVQQAKFPSFGRYFAFMVQGTPSAPSSFPRKGTAPPPLRSG